MALGRLLARVRVLAAAKARGATTAAAAQGTMAAAAARGRSVRACAGARARALRAQADGAARSAIACAEARARAARTFILRAKLETGTAALMARRRLRGASDTVVSAYLRAAYGESAPQTPSPAELLESFVLLVDRVRRIQGWISDLKKLRDLLDGSDLSVLIGMVLGPIALMYRNVVSTAPEATCPFLGLCPLESDVCPVRDGVDGVISVAATGGFVVALTVSGLIICLCKDVTDSAISMVSLGDSKEPNNLYNVHSCKHSALNSLGTSESQDTLSDDLAGITSPVDIGFFCGNADSSTMSTITSTAFEMWLIVLIHKTFRGIKWCCHQVQTD